MCAKYAIHEVVAEFGKKYKEIFKKNAAETFESLLRRSAVDVSANKMTCMRIRTLRRRQDHVSQNLTRMRLLDGFCFFLLITGLVIVVLCILKLGSGIFPETLDFARDLPFNIYWGISGVLTVIGLFLLKHKVVNDKIRILQSLEGKIRKLLNRKLAEAYKQMAPLNILYQWDTVTDLVMKSCPVFTFDKFFSGARMAELEKKFHFRKKAGKDSSICFCHSGSINENPFVLAESLDFSMGEKIYTGSLTITWTELVSYTDSKGRMKTRLETRVQTLYATVEKPCPEYDKKKFLIFGCGAAPDLTFSREPSGLADSGKGFFHRIKMKHAIRDLVRRSNDMSTNFTIMSNHKFDAVFAALDRDDEKDFRLLFTPLAQQEMLKILQDKKYGFGEDFIFRKKKMINFLYPGFLKGFDFSAKPSLFEHYDLQEARRNFNSYCNDFFRRIYFAFAPLLAIPLYQTHDTPGDLFEEDKLYYASDWEHESLANFYQSGTFKHPSCITECILKTSPEYNEDGTTTLHVTAYGFAGITKVDYISRFGGDGKWHNVPVEWIEYYPVEQTSTIILREVDEEGEKCAPEILFPGHNIEASRVRFRRNIAFYIP